MRVAESGGSLISWVLEGELGEISAHFEHAWEHNIGAFEGVSGEKKRKWERGRVLVFDDIPDWDVGVYHGA